MSWAALEKEIAKLPGVTHVRTSGQAGHIDIEIANNGGPVDVVTMTAAHAWAKKILAPWLTFAVISPCKTAFAAGQMGSSYHKGPGPTYPPLDIVPGFDAMGNPLPCECGAPGNVNHYCEAAPAFAKPKPSPYAGRECPCGKLPPRDGMAGCEYHHV